MGARGEEAEIDFGLLRRICEASKLIKKIAADRRFVENQSGKRKAVIVIRERGGNTLPAVFPSESPRAVIHPLAHCQGHGRSRDEFGNLERSSRSLRNEAHQPSRGIQPRRRLHQLGRIILLTVCAAPKLATTITLPALICFASAQEAAWREDNRRRSNGEQVRDVAGFAMSFKPSVDFCGYKQRHIK